MSGLTIQELTIPASVDDVDADDFIEMTRVRNEIEAETVGSFDLAYTPRELLPAWRDPDEPKRLFVAKVDGRIVGRAVHEAQLGTDVKSAWLEVEVASGHRRRGIGGALYDTVAGIAAHEGRTILQAFTVHRADVAGPRLDSPTGYGSVPREDAGARFLLARGFRLAQVERMSRLTLPAVVADFLPPRGYSLESWAGPTPEHRLADLAVLNAAMSTDPPLGETDWQPEVWDEERMRRKDALNATEGRLWLTTAVRHDASDRLVGFTNLAAPAEAHRPVFQNDTIVLTAHRGHRLGLVIKIANLARLQELSPGHPCIYTWNAEENRHMLQVNEQIGFRAVGYPGSWRLDL